MRGRAGQPDAPAVASGQPERARTTHRARILVFLRAISHHSDALLHKADWAASQDTFLQHTLPGP